MLIKISQSYSCVILKSIEQSKEIIDLEQNFQLNNIADRTQLNSSSLCLLVATNPRHESYYLHLKLRQRFLKRNFKCVTIGFLIGQIPQLKLKDLNTFSSLYFLNTAVHSISNLKKITKLKLEKNLKVCSELKRAR